METNRGVYITATLQAVPLDAAVALRRGVKRSADKIVLPASMSSELMKQSAHEVGTPFWEVSARDGRATCATALEYTAPDGVVMLPEKVIHSLWGYDVRPPPASFLLICTKSNCHECIVDDTVNDSVIDSMQETCGSARWAPVSVTLSSPSWHEYVVWPVSVLDV